MSEKILGAIATRLEKNLKKQVQNNLSEVFKEANCTAVAREIKTGRNVTGNAEFGIRFCIHNKTAPRVDPKTLRFTRQPKRAAENERKFIEITNDMLEAGGFSKMNPNLLKDIRKGDREFEQDIRTRRKKLKLSR